MKEHISRLLLSKLERHTPSRIKSLQLQILLNATADAFEQPQKKTRSFTRFFGITGITGITDIPVNSGIPGISDIPRISDVPGISNIFNISNISKRIGQAGRYPVIWQLPYEEALAAYADYTIACLHKLSDWEIDEKQVVQRAYCLGRRIRRVTGFTRQEDLERLVFYLYKNIGIKMTGQLPGEITIPACYFSSVYGPDQCRIMSLMDWGVISGICGGGKLKFSERLTQGCGQCRARLRVRQKKMPEHFCAQASSTRNARRRFLVDIMGCLCSGTNIRSEK